MDERAELRSTTLAWQVFSLRSEIGVQVIEAK